MENTLKSGKSGDGWPLLAILEVQEKDNGGLEAMLEMEKKLRESKEVKL